MIIRDREEEVDVTHMEVSATLWTTPFDFKYPNS